MSIAPLSETTVRLLGSTTAIVTPQDVVKELLDNAIDADATSIEVTLSPDTLTKIHVRDNGHGISVQNFPALGRRAYTSKLRSFDEVSVKGGSTLGFRGEALAAINTCARMTVTTRTSSDPIASRLQLKPGDGGIEERRPVSGPVGTTVQVNELFAGIPVRRKHVSKQAKNNTKEIKRLLQAYSLARQTLKLSLKFQGVAQSAWTYTPKHGLDAREAVLQVFGRHVRDECIYYSTGYDCQEYDATDMEMEVMLPSPGCNFSVLKSIGAFVSVDGRPLSPTRGIAKKLHAASKLALSSVLSRETGAAPSYCSTFLYLSIRCEPGTYDANITPLKDDVMFKDEATVIQFFKGLCKRAYDQYGTLRTPEIQEPSPEVQRKMPPFGHSLESQSSSRDILSTPVSALFNITQSAVYSRTQKFNGSTPQLSIKSRPVETLQVPSPEPCAPRVKEQPSFVSTTMRTRMKVNLSRTESNGTDDDTALEVVEVQVPRLPTPPPSAPTPKLRLRPSLRSIEDYFQPSNSSDFDIATDDTATAAQSPSLVDMNSARLSAGYSLNHMPLQSRTAASMNEIQAETGPVDEPSQGSAEASPTRNTILQDHELRHIRALPGAIDDVEETRLASRWRPLVGSPTSSTTDSLMRSSSLTDRHSGLRTLPLSDPTPSARLTQLPRLLNPGRLPRMTPPSARRHGEFQTNDVVFSTRSLSPASGLTSSHRISARRLFAGAQATRHVLPSIPDIDASSARHFASGTVVNAPRDSQEVSTTIYAERSGTHQPRTDTTGNMRKANAFNIGRNHFSNYSLDSSTPYSHGMQTLLGKTSNPPPELQPESIGGPEPQSSDVRIINKNMPRVSPQENTRYDDVEQSWGSSSNPCDATRTRGERRHNKKLQRYQSENMLLERVPEKDQLQRIVLRLRLPLHCLKALVPLVAPYGPQVKRGEGCSVLRFDTMSDMHLLEERIRRVVEPWEATKGFTNEMQFALTSQATDGHGTRPDL